MAPPGRLTGAGGPGFDVVEAARDTIDRYRMFDAGATVLVAVSGGPDSTCLFDVLARLAPVYDIKLQLAHVDHRLSPDSEKVASDVASVGAKAGLDVHVGRAPALDGPNLHARARTFRYSFFRTVAADVGATRIATGHTLDDRVETTLARLIHGAATDGLAGIPPIENERVRPLIGVRRDEARNYCFERGLAFHEDPANDDERFERAVVRNALVATIEERWGPGAIRAIATSSERLREDAELLSGLSNAIYAQIATTSEEGTSLNRELFVELGRGLRRRVLERAVGRLRDRSGGIQAALDALERPLANGARFAVASGIEIEAQKEAIIVRSARRSEGSAE